VGESEPPDRFIVIDFAGSLGRVAAIVRTTTDQWLAGFPSGIWSLSTKDIKSLSANNNLYMNWYNLAPDDKRAGEMKQG